MISEADGLGRLLEHLADETKPIAFSKLYALSDLCEAEIDQFLGAWKSFSTQRRRHLAKHLTELAESSFEVNLDAIFRRLLFDSDEFVRAAAIDGLWENESVSLIGPFLTLLRSDPSSLVRATAAEGLGRFVLAGELEQLDAPVQARILTELFAVLRLAGESADVRRRAIESAAYACTPEVLEAIENAYYDDEDMRLSAVVGMGRSCDRRWQAILLEELESTSAAMRYEASLACGGLMLQRAVPTLARLIHDSDRQVCNATIRALGQIGSRAAKQVLMDAYENADEDTCAALDDALAETTLLNGEDGFIMYDLEDLDEDMLVEEGVFAFEEDEDDWGESDWEGEDEEADESDWDAETL